MSSPHGSSSAILIIISSVMICTSATAYDASVSDFQWSYPQTLTPETGEIQYSFHFQLSPSSYPVDCTYRTQLYLSQDRIFSSDDFELFGPIDTLMPAGAIGFSSTVTRWFQTDTFLPATGTYYIFIEITPGLDAPPDTDSSNNTTMAPNPIQVDNGIAPPPPPPSEPALTVATVVTAPPTGRSILVTGYSDGVLEFRDWQAHVLATRDDFKEVTALAAGIVGSPPLPRLFVASTDSGGTLRIIDPANLNRDLMSHTNLGRVTAIEVRGGPDGAVYIGTRTTGGTLRKLNGLTLAHESVRGAMGRISEIIQVHSAWGDVLAVGSDRSGGSVSFLDRETLDDVVPRQENLGFIDALSSADMDGDGQAELVIATGADGGSIELREGPSFESTLAVRTGLGATWALDYGPLGAGPFAGPAGGAWILFASEPKGGSLNLMSVDIGASGVKFQDGATRRDLGPIHYAELHDFYMVGSPLAGAVWEGEDGPSLHVLDEHLNDPGATPVTAEGFETGDFSRFAWEQSGDADWAVTSQEKHSGRFSAESGSIGHNGSTTLQVRLHCASGNITFYCKVSCEPKYDQLRFTIDGVQQASWSGEADWAEVSFAVTAGTRTFTWTYSKDSSVSRGADAVWIDDIVFPIGSASGTVLSAPRSEEQPPYRIDIQYEWSQFDEH
jgi:hypothetical protein